MESDFKGATQQFQELKTLFNKPNPPLDKCKEIMGKLKVAILKFEFPVGNIDDEQKKRQLLLCREILEYGALLSVKSNDIPLFERYVAQLKTYYYDFGNKLPQSQRQYTILGLNLLRLLAKNKLDEFHTELELIPLEMHKNVYIKHPVQLEQHMMEGAYNKVFQSQQEVPSEYYKLFINMLTETIRDEIADCTEKAYLSLRLSEAQRMLGFSNIADTKKYAQGRQWQAQQVNGVDTLVFQREGETEKAEIPSLQVLNQTLQYARELERII